MAFLQLPGSPAVIYLAPLYRAGGVLCNGAAKRSRYKKSLP